MLYSMDELKALFTFPSLTDRDISNQNGLESELLGRWDNAINEFKTAAKPLLMDDSKEDVAAFWGKLAPAAVSKIERAHWNANSFFTECSAKSPPGSRYGGRRHS